MKHRLSPAQVRGVEDPATVLLIPMSLGHAGRWWSHDQILLGGIEVCGDVAGIDRCKLGYLPTPVPRSWGSRDFHAVVEYEAEQANTRFKLRVYYGCGDPSELHVGESPVQEGVSRGKRRMIFKLNPERIVRNEMFRLTLEVIRETAAPVLVYGAWLEVSA